MNVILLAGGAGVGKSTLATAMFNMYEGVYVIEAKKPIFEKIEKDMGIGYKGFMRLYDDRETKEVPNAWLQGLSPREYFFEAADALREEHGNNITSVKLTENIREAEALGYDWAVVPDILGDTEALNMILDFGMLNVFSFNLTREDVKYNPARRTPVTIGNVVDMQIVKGSPELTVENMIREIVGDR